MAIQLSSEQARRIQAVVNGGAYSSTHEALDAAVAAVETAGLASPPPQPATAGSLKSAADIVLDEMRKVPGEFLRDAPNDGSSQHDHYLYGWPKKQA